MNKGKVSVIIPIKNRSHLVSETLSSVLLQSYKNIEIILVDDHSSDALEAVLEPFKESIRLVKSEGMGPGGARNTGLKYASGDYIKFFDSDDLMTTNFIESQVRTLDESTKEFVTSPYFYAKKVEGEWEVINDEIINYQGVPAGRSLTKWMIRGLFIPLPAILFRRSFISDIGNWPENFVTSEDWWYLWKISLRESFPSHTNEGAFLYRVHDYQSTGLNTSVLQKDREKAVLLSDIYQEYFRSKSSWSLADKFYFKNKIFHLIKYSRDQDLKVQFEVYDDVINRFFEEYVRIKDKVGRIFTNTQWQPMHSVKKGGADVYLALI